MQLLRLLCFLWVRPGQLEERAEQIRSKSLIIQVEREKMQMELSHKRARVELERAASTSARSYEVGPGRRPRTAGSCPLPAPARPCETDCAGGEPGRSASGCRACLLRTRLSPVLIRHGRCGRGPLGKTWQEYQVARGLGSREDPHSSPRPPESGVL